jgi:histidinol-phosphate aminotransferase
MSRTIQPRAAILTMPEYHPPLAGRTAMRLDFNENTFEPSPKVMEVLRSINPAELTIYPERESSERTAAAFYGVKPEQLLLTNAVDEAIHIVTYTFLNEADEAIFAVPSFFMYDVNCMAMGADVKRIQCDDTLAFPYEKVRAAITPKTKLIILCSPNNPTGSIVPREQILALAAAAPQAVLLVDEAYFHFYGETVFGDIETVPNLVIARTFSKAYGLANLRLGVLVSGEALMQHMRKAASPYNVNGIALRCLDAALADTQYLDWYTQQVLTGRERVAAELRAMQVPFWPSHANFLLTRIGPKHKDFVAAMRRRGILLRDRSSDPGLKGCVRITIGVEDQNTKAIAAWKESLAEIGWTPADAAKTDTETEPAREYE